MNEENAMNTLTDRQQTILARGLSAFDQASRRRRARRRVAQGVAFASLLVACALLADRAIAPAPAGLPSYVELVRDDRQLAAELELANACERFSRTDGRLVVVECMVP